jgi:hypothetical protein
VLVGFFVAYALLPVFYRICILSTASSFRIPLWRNFPSIIAYLFFAILVFTKWSKLRYWQKGALVGIGIQSILFFVWMLIATSLFDKTLQGFMFSLYQWVDFILSPLAGIYEKFVIMPRAVLIDGVYVSSTNLLEAHLLFPLFNIIYSAIAGAVIAKIIEKRKTPAPK